MRIIILSLIISFGIGIANQRLPSNIAAGTDRGTSTVETPSWTRRQSFRQQEAGQTPTNLRERSLRTSRILPTRSVSAAAPLAVEAPARIGQNFPSGKMIGKSDPAKGGTLSGIVSDSLGGVVPGVVVVITDGPGKERRAVSNKRGEFSFTDLPAGKYKLKIDAPKFSSYENAEIEIKPGENLTLPVTLAIAPIETEVTVGDEKQISTDPDSSVSAIVLTEEQIENLPDDPEELEAYLRMLAGGAEGVDGPQFYFDDISSGRMPPKSSIREIRINRSPFSAENERLGYGGIEIFTKPGSDKFRGGANFNFNDARLNSRNPFALIRPPSQSRNFGGNLSGPIRKKAASFFFDYYASQQDTSRVINASVIDAAFNVVPYREEIPVPSRNNSFGVRIDHQLNKNNVINVRYGFNRNRSENQGVSDFSLPTRAFQTSGRNHDFRVSESMILNANSVNETVFAFSSSEREQEGDNSTPTINVSGSFMGGGSQIGFNFTDARRWELQNNTTLLFGQRSQHSLKFGLRMRGISIADRSESNFGGMFTFAGVRDTQTGVVFSSIEQYRQKVMGNPDPRFNPNQFTVTAGEALSAISQRDIGAFITDEWRIRGNLTISLGLRYENQSNIRDYNDLAPRFGIAYAPNAVRDGKPARTVIRGGIGIFYTRLQESFFLQAKRFSGTQQTQYIVGSNAEILGRPVFTLNGVKNVPTIAEISEFARQSAVTVRRISPELVSPVSYQFALSVDRQLPFKTKVAVTYMYGQNYSNLGMRNMNAPLCPPLASCPVNPPRPNPTEGNIYLYESLGDGIQKQLVVNFNSTAFKGLSLGGNYRFGYADNNIDGMGSFPAYSYDLKMDRGPSLQDIRHNFTFHSTIQMPWKLRISPNITASSGRPFNITTGVDSNRDSIFNDRPTYAQLAFTCQKLGLSGSYCAIDDVESPETTIIPRNYGRGQGFFNINLNLNRTFVLKREKTSAYNLIFAVQVSNLLNRTNRGQPIGNLSSNRFGQYFSTMSNFGGGANRRIELQVRFNF
jgi:hypothetical protein